MAGMYMTERFGAWQIGNDSSRGCVEFKLFFPDRNRAPEQFEPREARPAYGDPKIVSIRVAGDFQHELGQADWDFDAAPEMARTPHPKGWVWSYRTDVELPAGFYEYKYLLRFQDGTTRKVGDPCTQAPSPEQGVRGRPIAATAGSSLIVASVATMLLPTM